MDNDPPELSRSELFRWLVVAVVVLAGIALFLYFGPSSRPAVPPSVQESPR